MKGQVPRLKRIRDYLIYLQEVVGMGGFGVVYKGIQEKGGQLCAIKMIDKKKIRNNQYLQQSLMQEVDILRSIRSPNVVAILEILESPNNYYIIQELCDSDLEHYILEHKELSEVRAISIMSEIAAGFTELVREGIIHRDLKPANILMKDGQVKIADFGFSKNNICQKMKVGSFVGSPLYMAPQILRGEPYSSKCDVWAFGLIFYELLHKRTPWTGETPLQLVRSIEKDPLRLSPRLGPLTVDFLRHALRTEERDRMSWDEVFSHEIFCGMFEYLKQGQREIEDKLKMLMTAVRQEIDRKNISVTLLLETLQLKDELTLPQFTRFITAISPALASDDIRRIFDRLDADSSGTVEIAEIEAEMRKHFIDTSKHSSIKRTNTLPVEEGREEGVKDNASSTLKRRIFQELNEVLREKGVSLSKCFYAYSDGSHSIDFANFTKMMRRFGDFPQNELLAVFQEIDLDNSHSIELHEIELVFCQVNNVPLNAIE